MVALLIGQLSRWRQQNRHNAVLQKTGCKSDVECSTEGAPCDCLLKTSADKLLEVEQSLSWAPIVDGNVLHGSPYAALTEQKLRAIPVVIGSTLEDAFPSLPNDATDEDFKTWISTQVPAKNLDQAFDLYLGKRHRPEIDWIHSGLSAAHWASLRAKADKSATCVARRVARQWPARAWQYLWHTRFQGEDTTGFGPGICHSSDQHFLFETAIPQDWKPAAQALQRAVSLFVHTSTPSNEWPVGGGDGFIFHSDGPVAHEIRSEQCDFWDAVDHQSVTV